MGILGGHIESDEGPRAVRVSRCRDTPLMLMRFHPQTHVIALGTQGPDRRAQHRGHLRETTQKSVSSTEEGLLLSNPFRDPPTALCLHAQHGLRFSLSPCGLIIRSLFLAL